MGKNKIWTPTLWPPGGDFKVFVLGFRISDMTSEGLGEMFEGDSADTCDWKCPLMSEGGQAEGLANLFLQPTNFDQPVSTNQLKLKLILRAQPATPRIWTPPITSNILNKPTSFRDPCKSLFTTLCTAGAALRQHEHRMKSLYAIGPA